MIRARRFLEIEGYKQSKYHGLDKSNKYFEEIKGNHKEISEGEAHRSELRGNPEHDTEEDSSSKNVSKETQRERHNLDALANQMEPSDDDIDNFFNSIFAFKVKRVVHDIPHNPAKSNHNNMWNNDDQNSHPKCGIDVRINGTKIFMQRNEGQEPVEKETIEICPKDIEENTTYKPKRFWDRKVVA